MTTGRADIILDLETLGTRPGAVVVQIGAIAFRRDSGEVLSEFCANVDIASSLLAGLEIQEDTLAWWRLQSQETREFVFAPGQPLPRVVANFGIFWDAAVGDRKPYLWARGADFDPPIWLEAMRRVGEQRHFWDYNSVRDTRTAFDVLAFDPKRIPRRGAHTALGDARHDLTCLGMAGLFARGGGL